MLRHLLASPINVDTFFEVDGDVGNAVLGHRAHDLLVGNAQQLLLNRFDNSLLNFDRRHAWDFEDQLGLSRRNIRKCINRQIQPSLGACQNNDQSQAQREVAVTQAQSDEGFKHHSSFCSMARKEAKPLCANTVSARKGACIKLVSSLLEMILTGVGMKPWLSLTNTKDSLPK